MDVWDREMDVLKKTLTRKQLNSYFIQKNCMGITKQMHDAWNKLEAKGLTSELDSAKECAKTYMFFAEKMKIEDLYKNHDDTRKRALSELNKQMPTMVRMLEAIDKRKRVDEKMKQVDKQYMW